MKKGFTLIELLAVILILGVLTLITVVTVKPILKDSKKSLTNIQIENIEESASLYYVKHRVGLDDFELENPRDCINVSDLIEFGYIENKEVTNPKTGEKILGSVKVTYNSNNYIYEYQDNACTNYDKGIICERVKSTDVGNVPEGKFVAGDAYTCKVDPDKEPYKFYVLTTAEGDSDMVNLIMESNINKDGIPVKNGIADIGTIAWISQDLYTSLAGDSILSSLGCINGGTCAQNEFGPLSALDFLKDVTKDWSNLGDVYINSFIDDNNEHHTMEEYILKARLPYKSEISDYDSITQKNLYLYKYLEPGPINTSTSGVSGLWGYWTLSVDAYETEWGYYVGFVGSVSSTGVNFQGNMGVRPVISLYKFQME